MNRIYVGLRAFLCLYLSLFLCFGGRAEELLASDQKPYDKDIKISSVTLSGDRYETVTGRVLMLGTLAGPITLFSDVNGLTGWIENLSEVKEIAGGSLTDRTVYMRFSAPMGFADRDGYMRFIAAKEARGVVILAFNDIPAFSSQSDTVRMRHVRGRFRIEQLSHELLAVEFRLHYDSNASPIIFANLSVRQQVKQTLIRMRQRIEGSLRDVSLNGALVRSLGLE